MSKQKISKERPLLGIRPMLGPQRPQVLTTGLDRGAAVEVIPALKYQPKAVLAWLGQKPGPYEDAATTLIKVHGDLDAPTPNDAQRRQLNMPLCAGAPMVAVEQVRQMRNPAAKAIADAAPVKADDMEAAIGKHDCCFDAAGETRTIVQEAGDMRTVAGGTRSLMRDWFFTWYDQAKAQAVPGSARYLDLTSAFEGPRMLLDKILTRQAAGQKADETHRNLAMERLDAAQADLDAAQVVSDLRQGKPVDLATRLQAARHLRAQMAAQDGGGDPSAAARGPAAAGNQRKAPRKKPGASTVH